MGVNELAYRAATSPVGRRVVESLATRVAMPFGEAPSTATRRLRVVVTIDTEGGYVAKGERRIWQGQAPDAFQGYEHGIRNTLAVLDRHGVKGTFLVAPHGLSARGATLAAVERSILSIPRGGHEIGLHLHPTSDRALAARVGASFAHGSARYLELTEVRRLVIAGRALLTEVLGPAVPSLVSFRWGNWGLDERAARIVAEAGFDIDSSAVPGMRDRKRAAAAPDRPRFDWSARRSMEPWEIAPGLLELPIATFRCLGRLLRADPLYGPLLVAALERYRACAPTFVVMTHSTEATHRDGSPTRALADLDAFLARACSLGDVEIVTLRQAATGVSRVTSEE